MKISPCFRLLMLLLSANHLFAQSTKWEFGPSLLSTHYLGDLVESRYPVPDGGGWGGQLQLSRHLGEAWSFRINGSFLQLKGSDLNFADTRTYRSFSFTSSLYELSLLGEWDLLGRRRYDKGRLKKTFSPYLLGGIAGVYFDPNPIFGVSQEAPGVQNDMQRKYEKTGWSIPLGGGLRYDLSRRTTINAEYMMRIPSSDYLDGISESANPDSRDWYMTFSLGVSFKFGRFKDRDGDRVFDRYDKCPDITGEKTLAGCPDTDGDGIIDQDDRCPYQRGSTGMQGCPDRDGDGVADKEDRCPDDLGEKSLGGCPDKDNDGVADIDDTCPDRMGKSYTRGCPDADADSIPDIDDQCPTRRGVLYAKGCPDTDRDSIPDDLDRCPNEAGLAVNQGCPDRDKDNDGIVDRLDVCPDKAGLANFKGCPDTDSDGLPDPQDNCPAVAGIAALKGCPEVKKEELAVLARATLGVQFESGKSTLKSSSFLILNEVAALMQKYPSYKLTISGHTDSDGNDAKNLTLSEARAKTCLDYLASKGVTESRMAFSGYGETKPLAPNTTKANKAKNRRVEFDMATEKEVITN